MIEAIAQAREVMVGMAKSIGSEYPEDLIQDIILTLIEREAAKEGYLERFFDDEGRIKLNYLFFVIRNAYIDLKRKDSKWKTVEFQIEKDFRSEGEPYDVEADIANQKLYEKVVDAVKEMDAFHRQLFNLKLRRGMSYREISEGSYIGRNTLAHGVKKIKKHIQDATRED